MEGESRCENPIVSEKYFYSYEILFSNSLIFNKVNDNLLFY